MTEQHPSCIVNGALMSIKLNANVSGHRYVQVAGSTNVAVLMCEICGAISCPDGEYVNE